MKNHSLLAFLKLERLWKEALSDSRGGGFAHVDPFAHVNTIEIGLVALWKALTRTDRVAISEDRVRNAEKAYRTTLTIWHHTDPLELTEEELGAKLAEGSIFVEHRETAEFTNKETLFKLDKGLKWAKSKKEAGG